MSVALNDEFAEILEPLGRGSADFFLAAGLYQAHKLSFGAAAHLAGLSFDDFAARLREHFDSGFRVEDEAVLEDLATVEGMLRP